MAGSGPATDAPCALNDTWECAEPLTVGGRDTDEFRGWRPRTIDTRLPRAGRYYIKLTLWNRVDAPERYTLILSR